MYSTILIGYDGDEASHDAFTLARLLSGSENDARLVPTNVSPGAARRDLRVIGVGYDGPPQARSALAVAAQLARDRTAVVEVIGVVVPPGYHGPWLGYGYDEFVSMLEVEVRERLESALSLVGPDVSTKLRLLHGEPATALAAAWDDIDLLVVGSRGHGLVGRALLGSVSARVMRMAACPVLVVTRGVAKPPLGAGEAEARHGATPDA